MRVTVPSAGMRFTCTSSTERKIADPPARRRPQPEFSGGGGGTLDRDDAAVGRRQQQRRRAAAARAPGRGRNTGRTATNSERRARPASRRRTGRASPTTRAERPGTAGRPGAAARARGGSRRGTSERLGPKGAGYAAFWWWRQASGQTIFLRRATFPLFWRYGENRRPRGFGGPRPGIPARCVSAAGAGRHGRNARRPDRRTAGTAVRDALFSPEPSQAMPAW